MSIYKIFLPEDVNINKSYLAKKSVVAKKVPSILLATKLQKVFSLCISLKMNMYDIWKKLGQWYYQKQLVGLEALDELVDDGQAG